MTPDRLPGLTLDGLLRAQAEATPDAPALVDRHRSFTFGALDAAVGGLASHLRDLGLQPGGVVLALPRRTWELPVLFLATTRAGGVFAALDGRTEHDRVARMATSTVDVAFLAPNFDGEAERLSRLLGDPRRVIRAEDEGGLAALLDSAAPLPPSRDPGVVCTLNFSSGTAGPVRAVPTTHAHIQWNTRAVLETMPFRSDERFLCLFAPHSHPHELFARPLAAGAVAVMQESLRPRSVLEAVRTHGVTWLFAVPSVVELLLAGLPDAAEPVLRVVEVGGAALDPDLLHRVEARLARAVIPIWGCTEASGVALCICPSTAPRRLDTLGAPLCHYDMSIDGGEVGELRIRGPAVTGGGPDGWVRTGDLVRSEPDGALRFLGRRDEVLQRGADRVLLLEVERVIAAIPGVRQVAVVPDRGQTTRAAIVRAEGSLPGRAEILAACGARLPEAMVPDSIEFWEELPTTSGRIHKAAIMDARPRPLAVAVNSMITAHRPLDQVFRLAAGLRCAAPVVVDLRSRRAPASDPHGRWAVAHDNADFDLADPHDVARAVALSRAHGVPIAAASAYAGACNPEDRSYGCSVIDRAVELAEAAPDETLLLRMLGGDLLARARGLDGRWQDIRRALRDESLATIRVWEAHARQRAAETGRRVVLGLEIHHGQYLGDLLDIHHCCRALQDVGWEHVGFIEDPANRFIAAEGDRLGAVDFARMVRAWGGRIVGYHLKDVRYVAPWSQFFPQPLQRVGEPIFVWGMHKYAWTSLGEGEVDLADALVAASRASDPPHRWCLVSTEFVAASRDEAEAARTLASYAALIDDGAPQPATLPDAPTVSRATPPTGR